MKSVKEVQRKAGRPRGRAPRPHITLPNGSVLIPKSDAASEIGVAVRIITRMRLPSTRIGGVCYVARGAVLKAIADNLTTPSKRRAKR